MRKTVVGAIAVVTATSVISLTGAGLASAAMTAPSSPAAVAFAPAAEAQHVQGLHDQLKLTFDQKNVSAVLAAVNQLSAELAKLRAPAARAAMSPDSSTLSTRAQAQDLELKQQLDAGITGALPTSGLLDSVTGLVSSLLQTLLSLVSSLLGGLPTGALPVSPPTGGLPVGGLPVGGLPVGGLPTPPKA